LTLASPEAKSTALEKLAPISDATQNAFSISFFQQHASNAPEILAQLAKRFTPSARDAEGAIAASIGFPEHQKEILAHSAELTFETLSHFSSEELQRNAISKLLPPPNGWTYNAVLEQLSPAVRSEVAAKFSRPSSANR